METNTIIIRDSGIKSLIRFIFLLFLTLSAGAATRDQWFTTNSVAGIAAPTNGWMLTFSNGIPAWSLNAGALTNFITPPPNLIEATNNDLFVSNLLHLQIVGATNGALSLATNNDNLIGLNATNNDVLSSNGLYTIIQSLDNPTNNDIAVSNNLYLGIVSSTNNALFLATNNDNLIGLNSTNFAIAISNSLWIFAQGQTNNFATTASLNSASNTLWLFAQAQTNNFLTISGANTISNTLWTFAQGQTNNFATTASLNSASNTLWLFAQAQTNDFATTASLNSSSNVLYADIVGSTNAQGTFVLTNDSRSLVFTSATNNFGTNAFASTNWGNFLAPWGSSFKGLVPSGDETNAVGSRVAYLADATAVTNGLPTGAFTVSNTVWLNSSNLAYQVTNGLPTGAFTVSNTVWLNSSNLAYQVTNGLTTGAFTTSNTTWVNSSNLSYQVTNGLPTGAFTISNGAPMDAFVIQPSVNVWTNGVTNYVTTTGNDATFVRGDSTHPSLTISNCIALSQAKDTINIASGSYNVTNPITLLNGMSIYGAGNNSTFVTNWVLLHDNSFTPGSATLLGPCFRAADNTIISNLCIVDVQTIIAETGYQSAYGTGAHTVSGNDAGFTNAVFAARIIGRSDGIFVDTTNHCQVIIVNPDIKTTWDTVAINGVGAFHDIQIYGGTLTNKGADTHSADNGGVFISGTNNTVLIHGAALYSDKTTGYAVRETLGARAILSSCTFVLPSSTTHWIDASTDVPDNQLHVTFWDCNVTDPHIFGTSYGDVINRFTRPVVWAPTYDASGAALAATNSITSAWIQGKFPGVIVTNGGTTAITYSNDFGADISHSLFGGGLGIGRAGSAGTAFFESDAQATTPTSVIQLTNGTASTASVSNQYSPAIIWSGHQWNGSAGGSDQPSAFRAFLQSGSAAASISSTWSLQKSINGGAFVNVLTVTDGGNAQSSGNLVAGGLVRAAAASTIEFSGRTKMSSPADGDLEAVNNAGTSFNRLILGPVANTWPTLYAFTNGAGTAAGASILFSGGISVSNLTTGHVIKVGADSSISSVASGAVPIDGDGTATTFAQVNALAFGDIVTNGTTLSITYSNALAVDAAHTLTANGPLTVGGVSTVVDVVGSGTNALNISASTNKVTWQTADYALTAADTFVLLAGNRKATMPPPSNPSCYGKWIYIQCSSSGTNAILPNGAETFNVTSGQGLAKLTNTAIGKMIGLYSNRTNWWGVIYP